MTDTTKAAKTLRRAMQITRGDNLERANHQFKNWSDEQLDAPYGESGMTGREIWQEYKDARADWEAANALLEEMLKARGL